MLKSAISCIVLVAVALTMPAISQSKRPVLIRDTDKAEGKDEPEASKPKEYDPAAAEKSFSVGNFYYKRRNYDAAVDRYLEALEYEPGLGKARDALERACAKALEEHRNYIRNKPTAGDVAEHKDKIAKLEKALAELKAPKPK